MLSSLTHCRRDWPELGVSVSDTSCVGLAVCRAASSLNEVRSPPARPHGGGAAGFVSDDAGILIH